MADEPASSCFAFGSGNISGSSTGAHPDPLHALLSDSFGPGHVLIDKSDDASSGLKTDALAGAPSLTKGLSGTFSFVLPDAGDDRIWSDIVLAFKSGGRNTTWAAFLLGDGVTSGTWSITNRQALSHANLYARKIEAPDTAPVPLPAAGLLLVAGLGGLAAFRRKAAQS